MLRSTYTPQPLPPGWTEHRAPTGHLYYYNAATKQSTYKRPQAPAAAQHALPPSQSDFAAAPAYIPQTLPPFSSAPYGPAGYPPADFHTSRGFRGGKGYQDRKHRVPSDRPKSKHPIPNCDPWVLVKTKLGRRFVYNPDTNQSFWKFPTEVLKGVVEYDRLEREKKEQQDLDREDKEDEQKGLASAGKAQAVADQPEAERMAGNSAGHADDDSDEYEEVEVTDSEQEDAQQASKRAKLDGGVDDTQQPLEFTEQDIEYQLAAMGEDYGLDPGEYGEPGEEGWEAGAEGLLLTDEDANCLFRDLLDDFHVNPYTTWDKILEEGHIIEDSRYTALPNMKARRDAWSCWSRDRIRELKERREKQEKKDPRIRYLAFLQQHATPKLYWPEFKRKYRKEPEMKDPHLSDKDREKIYRDYISRLKLPEGARKADLSALLQSVPLQLLNRFSSPLDLPPSVLTDIRYILLTPNVRDPLIEAYISTLPEAAPGKERITEQEQQELDKKRLERGRREKALADREKRVQEQKRQQQSSLQQGKQLLREGEAEIEQAMRVRKGVLLNYAGNDLDSADTAE